MIRYTLKCEAEHTFEAWFGNSAAFDKQARRGLVDCPQCGSTTIEKALMAPNVGVKGNRKAEAASAASIKAANVEATQHVPSHAELRALMRRLRTEVEATAENVGPRFAEEARKIHFEETEPRGIYGEASAEETRALKDEGIEFYPIPRLPEDQN